MVDGQSKPAMDIEMGTSSVRSLGRSPAWAILPALFVAGCMSVGPDYKVPEASTPDVWNQVLMQDIHSNAPVLVEWWTVLNDPLLSGLVSNAAVANYDVKAVLARLEAAEARYGITKADYYPTVQGVGSANAIRTSEDISPDMPSGIDREGGRYQVGAQVAWEIDFWGRVRRSVESAIASTEAAEEAYRDSLVVISSQVALTHAYPVDTPASYM